MALETRSIRSKSFAIVALIMATFTSSPSSLAADSVGNSHGPLKVNIMQLTNFSSDEKEKLYRATDLLERVLNSEEFKQAVLNHTYQGKKQFVDNNGLTNEQIYEVIRRGNETLIGKNDETVDLDLELYNPPFWKRWSVVGYTYEDTLRIWMNRNYFYSFDLADMAANLSHEWMHKIGFDHDYNRTAQRPYSVPYAVGDLVTEIGGRMEQESAPSSRR